MRQLTLLRSAQHLLLAVLDKCLPDPLRIPQQTAHLAEPLDDDLIVQPLFDTEDNLACITVYRFLLPQSKSPRIV